jgi:co-chaperonin GroES (HSP10)
MKPVGPFVLLKKYDPVVEKQIGGLFIPSNTKGVLNDLYEVVAFGTGEENEYGKQVKWPVKLEDVVVLDANASITNVSMNGEKFIQVHYLHILATAGTIND